MAASLIESFSILEDPRIERNKRHQLIDIIVLVISAVISGAEGWEAIEEFGKTKLDWLRRFVPLENGIPSPDCIRRVISRLSAQGFQECFMDWVSTVSEVTAGEIVAIDGKTLRRSHDRKQDKKPIHIVSAWASENGVALGQIKTAEKSNEITAVPELLELLDINGFIVTLDAMGCQHGHADKIIAGGADYVLAVKGNQGNLHEAVEDYFMVAREAEFQGIDFEYSEEKEKSHGRIEVRRYWITEDLQTLPSVDLWKGLRSIGMVERVCHQDGKETVEVRYYINSIPADAKLFSRAVRGHWGIENSLHWVLDVVFREDESRIRRGNAPEIMNTVRQMALNLLRKEPSTLSIKKKRLKAAWNDDYRANLLVG